ncbi:hypothetical protein M426DRAFT_193615 [Hypoxylon sp. CI-4A]|nr:hypothetical protein M426DRAFT_193615 [Hypoxylon sp. CI-4A]
MATEDARYRQSSQYRLWTFTPSHLNTLREKTNALAETHISNRLRASGPSPATDSLPQFLTPAEEYELLNYFIVETMRAASYAKLTTDMMATAVIFLRRFYTTNSLMTYPPQELLKTSLFFASKAEGYFGNAGKIAAVFGSSSEAILAAEYVLCQGIRFAFDVKHPFRALEGLIMDLKRQAGFSGERIGRAHKRARAILKFSPLLTDAYFHYTPSQIAYAALSMADDELIQHMLQAAFAGQGEDVKEKVWRVIQSCKAMLDKEPPETMASYQDDKAKIDHFKKLRRKLNKCRDPDRVNLVALQKARREQAAQKSKAKPTVESDENVFGNGTGGERESKRRKVAAGGDPFGPPLGAPL